MTVHSRFVWEPGDLIEVDDVEKLDKLFDESKHPRDPKTGEFSETGGSGSDDDAPKAPKASDNKEVKAALGKDIAHPNLYSIREKVERGAWNLTVDKVKKDYRGSTTRIGINVPIPSNWVAHTNPYPFNDSVEHYDPSKVVLDEDGRTAIKIDTEAAIPKTATPGVIYRGMSWEEYQGALKNGHFKSRGDYNLGEAQVGLTYYSSDPGQAVSYAHGFAPSAYKAVPGRPAVVVGVADPGDHYVVPQQPTELGIRTPVPTSAIREVYFGEPILAKPGYTEVIQESGRPPMEGSGNSPSVWINWRKEGDDKVQATKEASRHHPGEGYTAEAYIANGVIYTDDVYDAARAIQEDRAVELDQPRTASLLITELGKISKNMIAHGEQAPTFNLCKVTIKGTSLFCADSAGIPRVQMPQLTMEQDKPFFDYLKSRGYTVERQDEYASYLHATQNELNGAKVAGIAEKMRSDAGYHSSSNPIFVSQDNYILDGHHRWAAEIGIDATDNVLANDKTMAVWRVNLSITRLLEEAEAFTGGEGKLSVADEAARKRSLQAKADAHTDWMNECVPKLMDYGKDQLQAVAACLNMWREAWEESHPDGADDPGPSPKEADPDSPLAEAAKEKMLARARKLFSRAQPKTLYVHRKLLNRDEVIAWAKAQGFATTLDDEMHVTVAFSKQPFDWGKVSPDSELVTVAGGRRSVEELGDEGAIVLRFESQQLQADWQRYLDAGASWDYPGYKPHVTITYDAGDVDLDQVEPYRGELRFGPEAMAEIKDDLEIKERLFNEAEHPRDEHGRWTDGSGSDDLAPAPAPAREGTKADMEARYGKPSANWQATASGLNTKEEQRLERDNNFIRRNQEPTAYSAAVKVENDLPYYSEYIKTDADHSHWSNFITTPKGIAEANLMMVFGADKPTLEIQTLLSKDRGSGRAALEMITKAADAHGVYLQLDPVPLEPHGDGIKMPKDKLEAFYAQFGFVQEGERDEGGEGTITMVRKPRGEVLGNVPNSDDSMLFVSEMPNQNKLDRWNDVLNARSAEIGAAGEAGSNEDDQIAGMQSALAKYSQEDEASLKAETAGLNAVYDSEMKLQAAAFSYVSNKAGIKTATISSFGALHHAAGVKALQQVTNKYAKTTDQISGTFWGDDAATRAMYEAAGFKQLGETEGGITTMVKTELPGGGVTQSQVKMRLSAEAIAKKLDFDPAKIVYTDEDKDFVLGGVSYKYAGSYQRGEPDIKLYTRQITPENIKGITAHEIGHRKFEMLRNQLKIQTEMMMQDKGPPPDPNHKYWWGKKGGSDAIMNPQGEMRPPYDEKYPIVHEWAQIQNMRPSLEQDDGITPYSKSYWTEWEKGQMATDTAYHETMAEMSRNLGVMGKHSAVTGKGWRRLYDLQEKVWAKTEDWQRDMSMNAPIKSIFMIDGILWEVR